VGDRVRAVALLESIGYYRLTGYLYPFRKSEQYVDDEDRGRASAFAHEDPASFTDAFTTESTDARAPAPSSHVQWLQRVNDRRARSDEQFVAHFREQYGDRVPVWALTETLELGQLSVFYRGLRQQGAEEIAMAFGVPTKRLMVSWLASLNYVRNVAAHHARLFNRKLQHAPARPKAGQVPLLDHLRDAQTAKGVFGTYNALAVIAYLLRWIEIETEWTQQLVALLQAFPASPALSTGSMGIPQGWETLDLWRP
jgi:abortive infection bacteriophage resistance protein